jgi:hypothetical protein
MSECRETRDNILSCNSQRHVSMSAIEHWKMEMEILRPEGDIRSGIKRTSRDLMGASYKTDFQMQTCLIKYDWKEN